MQSRCPTRGGLAVQPLLTAALVAAWALGAVACAPTTAQQLQPPGKPEPAYQNTALAELQLASPDSFAYGETQNLLRAGLMGITERYLEPVSAQHLALGAIEGMASVDPYIRLEGPPATAGGADASARYLLRYREKEIARFLPPADTDITSWAALTTQLLREGRAVSPELNAVDANAIHQALFDGMLSELDVFSRYAGPDEARENRSRRDGFGGIGIRYLTKDGDVVITQIMVESPAAEAGMLVGDRIVSISGTRLKGKRLREVSELLRGPAGSPVDLQLDRQAGDINQQLNLHMVRAHIVAPTVTSKVEGDVLVVQISSFNMNTASSLHEKLQQASPMIQTGRIHALVLDLRGNPGGLLTQSVNVADLFLEEGAIVSTRGRHPDSMHEYLAGGIDVTRGLPMVLLIDGDSASAAEIVAGALQDRGRAVVVGSSSYGKGTAQTVIRLPNGGEITLSWSRLLTPSGYAIHGLGISPTLCSDAFEDQSEARKTGDGNARQAGILAVVRTGEALGRKWRELGVTRDQRRILLRQGCPARSLDHDMTTPALAEQILSDSVTYQAVLDSRAPRDTAARQ